MNKYEYSPNASFLLRVSFAVFLLLSIQFSSRAQKTNDTPHYHHYIELNIGEPLSSVWGANLMFVNHSPEAEARFHSWADTYRPFLNGLYSGYEDEWMTVPVTISYYNQILNWMQVGAEVSTMSLCTTEKTWEGSTYAYYLTTNLYVLGGLRFNYYHKGITDLYSGLSLGAKLMMESTQQDGIVAVTAGLAFQLTALGVRFGKRVYGSAELGYGYKGLLNVGIGVRL